MRRSLDAIVFLLLVALLLSLSCRNAAPPNAASSPDSSAVSTSISSSDPSSGGVSAEAPRFDEVAEAVGLHFQHFSGATQQKYFPEIMGAGVALLDYDNDGALDVLLIQGDWVDPRQKPEEALFPRSPGQRRGCRLFHNDLLRTGKLHFTDVTEQAGLGHLAIGVGMGVAVGDYDNDGFPDIYITGYKHSVLLHNNGNGTFTDVTRAAGVGDDGNWATSAAFVDYDLDGKLDLAVANYVDFTVANNQHCKSVAGPPDYCGPTSYRGVSARLYHNLGGGRLQDVTRASGLGSVRAPGLGVACADFDGDGWPDIFIANDQAANTLWLNRHNGTFRESALLSGCAFNEAGVVQANMGLAVGDIDNRGGDDVLITHLVNEGVTLYRNDGHANFRDTTAEARLRDATFPFTGFGTDWFDYDNDGRLDLFVANGAVATEEKQRGSPWPFAQTNQLFHNIGVNNIGASPPRPKTDKTTPHMTTDESPQSEARFVETTALAGPAFRLPGVGRGAAFGDLDNDGRVDIVVTNNNGPARLLLNRTVTRNHWLEIRLEGVRSNRMGLGTKVGIVRTGQPLLWRRCHTDGSYCSASDARIHFGLGPDPTVEAVIVQWPGRSREQWNAVRTDRIITLREGTGKAVVSRQ